MAGHEATNTVCPGQGAQESMHPEQDMTASIQGVKSGRLHMRQLGGRASRGHWRREILVGPHLFPCCSISIVEEGQLVWINLHDACPEVVKFWLGIWRS